MTVPSSPDAVLQRVFGFSAFRDPQAEVIASVIAGRDTFVLMPTGGGKSLCFQIPALVMKGTAIVVSPLISLMKDQVDALVENGVAAAFYNSSLTAVQAKSTLNRLFSGELRLLYVAPERLLMPEFLTRIKEIDVSLFAIDESHCISSWGHDFRPEYVQLGLLKQRFPMVPIVALTATADAVTREDILSRLGLVDPNVFVSGFDRPNIRYTVVDKHNPAEQLKRFVLAQGDEAGIVYCLSRKRVEQVAEELQEAGISAQPYHAGLDANTRAKVQEQFQRDEIRVVVATVAFGMGIDKSNVRFVVHYDMPKNVEGYYQETGRAGRDGLPSEALLLYGIGDVVTAKSLIEKSGNPQQRAIELRKLNAMVDMAEAQSCRRLVLLKYFGEDREVGCGNCDICLSPPETYDATEEAKTAFMTVYALKQRFGVTHVIDVIRGSQNARIASLHHDQIETFGKGSHRSAAEWSSILRQLIHLGYLTQDIANFAVVKLTPRTRPVLREGERVTLATPRVKEIRKREKKQAAASGGNVDHSLFDILRAIRMRLANERDVPPYVIFGDGTLKEMAKAKPTTPEQFLALSGVGSTKLERYGASFLAAIREHKEAS